MFILIPESRERVWGTPRLHAYSGDQNINQIGSVYSASGIEGIDCKIVGSYQSLNEIIQIDPERFGLREGDVYPLIISFTACDKNLSIQVHPTDEYARIHESMPYGKSEAWYFITPPEEGWIYAEQTSKEKESILTAVDDKRVSDVLQEYPIQQYDLVYIPSGTIHALTEGSLVYEIQQATDITYRFYDYDRLDKDGKKRELHVEKAIETLQLEQKVEKDSFHIGQTVEKREFTIQHFSATDFLSNPAKIASVATILSGELYIGDQPCAMGQSIVLLPEESIEITGCAEVVLATPHIYW